ncbi:hypothetical protein BH24ACT5_BH24ACT5_31380 [soil metagenome]
MPGSRNAQDVAASPMGAAGPTVRRRPYRAFRALTGMALLFGTAVPTTAVESSSAQPRSAGGAGSPDGAVQELIDSVVASDPLGVLAVLHPDERLLVKSIYESAGDTAAAAGAIDIDALARALRIEVTTTPLAAVPLTDDLVWVTTDAAALRFDIDAVAADNAVALDLTGTDVEPSSSRFDLDRSRAGIAAVRRGDNWFVSALYTAAELLRRDEGRPARFSPGAPPADSSKSPEAAVDAFLAAVQRKDPRAVAATLTPFEGRLVADYESSLGSIVIEALAGYELTTQAQHQQQIVNDGSRAVVEIDQWAFGVRGEPSDGYGSQVDIQIEANGLCGAVTARDSYDGTMATDSGCAFTESGPFDVGSVLADDGWRGPRLVVVDIDGSWRVSLLETVLGTVAPVLGDPFDIAAVAELFGGADLANGFYVDAIQLVGIPMAQVPAGRSAVTTLGSGRVGVFHVSGMSEITVYNDAPSCVYFVVATSDDSVQRNECNLPAVIRGVDAVVVVTASVSPFTGPAPIGAGEVDATP